MAYLGYCVAVLTTKKMIIIPLTLNEFSCGVQLPCFHSQQKTVNVLCCNF